MDPVSSTSFGRCTAPSARSPVHIISAYRSPQTNQALRSRSRAVSEHSQHMLGRAMDIRFPDVDPGRIREAAMRVQQGGVGFYPGANFVHVDVGSVRAWPRMSREQLAQLFPDGKTVHLPSDGKPLAGYEQARAEILSRGSTGSAEPGVERRSLWASLFGRRDDGLTPVPATADNSPPASPGLCSLAAATASRRPRSGRRPSRWHCHLGRPSLSSHRVLQIAFGRLAIAPGSCGDGKSEYPTLPGRRRPDRGKRGVNRDRADAIRRPENGGRKTRISARSHRAGQSYHRAASVGDDSLHYELTR